MNFQNKISRKFDRLVLLYKNSKYDKQYDELKSLYVDRTIKNITTAKNILIQLNKNNKNSIKAAINKINKIKKNIKIPVINKYFVTVEKLVDITYKDKNNKEFTVENQTIIHTKEIKATNKQEAEKIALDDVNTDDDLYGYDSLETVAMKNKSSNITSIVDASNAISVKPELQFLEKSSNITDYNFIPEEKKFLDLKSNTCVEDNLYGIYSPLIKKINSIQYIRNLATEFYEDLKWDYTMGYTSTFIKYFCEKHNIGMYAFDIQNKCFLHHLTRGQNYPVLYFYAVNGHMYLIKNQKRCKELTEKAKSQLNHNFNTSIVKIIEKNNIFDNFKIIDENDEIKYNIYDNIKPEDILKYSSCIFMYTNKTNINDIFTKCIDLYGIPLFDSIISNKINITQFSYNINKQNYIFCLDPNDEIHINYKMVMYYCIKNNIDWKNQSFPSFIRQMKDKHFEKKSERINITDEIKNKLLKLQNNKCNECKEILEKKYEIDHIRPLANGGDNELDNLQILCKPCHKNKCNCENEDGSYIRLIDSESSFNNRVREIINSDLNKHYAFVENIDDLPTPLDLDYNPNYKLYSFDINKCRKNLMYYNKINYPVFTVMDDIKPFDKNIFKKCGLFYVETTNYNPFHGNGFYHYPLIKYALEINIITYDDIKFIIESSLELKHNYYNSFIDETYNNKYLDKKNEEIHNIYNNMEISLEMTDPKKLAINSLIGGFKPNLDKNKKWKSICITSLSTEAYEYFLKDNACYINTIKSGDKVYYHVYKEYITTNIESEQPIYDQIIDMECVELHKLKTIIENNGGVPLDLKTDAIVCYFKNNEFPFELMDDGINIKDYYWDDNKQVPKYKIEEAKRLDIERMPFFRREDKYIYENQKLNIINDVEDNDFNPLVGKVINGNSSYFVTGPAGCGKTHLLNQLKDKLVEINKSYICLTPTNLSALLLNGKTIHKFVTKIKKMESIYNLKYDYIFVDEISMVKECFYKFLLTIKMIKKNINFIISGDFNQLKPINDRANFDYKNSLALKELSDFNVLQLSKCRRSDDKLFNLCKFENIMHINKSIFNDKIAKINLSFTNKKRIEINQICMERYKTKKYKFIEKDKNNEMSQDIYLYDGLPLISKINNEKLDIINNEQYIVINYNNEITKIKSKIDDRILDINTDDIIKYFVPSYCITIHCSQGLTINEPYNIHEWHKLNEHLRYVSLTRSSKMEYINIV